MLRFSSCEWAVVTQGLSTPLPEYTIHTDLLNAASLLRCITAALSRGQRNVEPGLREGEDLMEERDLQGGERGGWRSGEEVRQKKVYGNACLLFSSTGMYVLKSLLSLWCTLFMICLCYKPKILNFLSLFLSVGFLNRVIGHPMFLSMAISGWPTASASKSDLT